MNKYELNKYAINHFKSIFKKHKFMIDESIGTKNINFSARSVGGKLMKIRVRSISQIGSYIFIKKDKFDINDNDLYMAVLYNPKSGGDKAAYLVPATEWGNGIYPFIGRDYKKPGQVSKPEWGINFSNKAMDAMEPYRLNIVIDKYK